MNLFILMELLCTMGSLAGVTGLFISSGCRVQINELIAKSIHHCCWLQIKRVIKLCNNETASKRGEPHYNPAYKFENLNAITEEEAELDLCGDVTRSLWRCDNAGSCWIR